MNEVSRWHRILQFPSTHRAWSHWISYPLFYGIYDTRDRILTYVSAGHRPPLILYRQQRDTFEQLAATGIPLGIFAGVPYAQQTTTPLEDGDVVLLLTDGVEEAVSEAGEWFGKELCSI
jgi:sigma-B regulation protein RsbU (phosphoserine phosphatase)